MTVIIEGYNNPLSNSDYEYDLQRELGFETGFIDDDEPLLEIVENVSVKIYKCPKKISLEEAEIYILDKYFGSMSIETQDYGYSEYTIEGFSIESMKIGNHNLMDIIDNMDGYKIIVIEKMKQKEGE